MEEKSNLCDSIFAYPLAIIALRHALQRRGRRRDKLLLARRERNAATRIFQIEEISDLTNKDLSCPPADPNPRAPTIKAPPGTCDTHAHVFEARFPYSPRRGYTPPDAPYEAYRHLLDTLGSPARC